MRIAALLFVALACSAPAGAAERWWPAQSAPEVIVRAGLPANDAEEMLQHSVAGLLAQAVNEGRAGEMVWIDEGRRGDYAKWYRGTVKRLGAREEAPLSTLDLVRRYAARGIIKGYIVYRGPDSDESVNVATTLAGILGGVIVSEELEPAVKALGLDRLADARNKTSASCFREHRHQLNRSFVLSQRPRIASTRDVAIAHRMLVFWGDPELTASVYAWLRPLSTVIGWVADEGNDVGEASRYGHVVIPSDFCLNVPLLSAGVNPQSPAPRLKSFDPGAIDPNEKRSAVAFVISDGDNLQWAMGGFFGNPNYWASPDHGKFPIGFGLPYHNLTDVCPEALAHAVATQPDATSVIETSGYIFPDTFAAALGPRQRRELLAQHARRLARSIGPSTGVSSLVFICRDVNSPAAVEAYEIYAREIDGLAGMFVVQYAPYSAGDGKVHWVKNRAGEEIPVVTSKFSLWANNKHPGAGNPDRIAGQLNETARQAAAKGEAAHLWVMTHAWSSFQRDETGKVADLPRRSEGGSRGVTPTGWCVSKLDTQNVVVVSPAELLWRIRNQRGRTIP